MSRLYSSDVAAAGVWRAYVVKPLSDGKAHVYIPNLHSGLMPFKDEEDPSQGVVAGCESNYPVANSCSWKVRTALNVGDVVWVIFENGDINHPIMTGNFATLVPIVTPGMGGGGMYSGDATTGNANADKIFKLCISECGLSIAAACGVLGNASVENPNFEPGLEAADGTSTSMGIFMFYQSGHGGRGFSNLKAHCGSYGYDTVEGQMEYLRQWFNNEIPGYGGGQSCKTKLLAVPDSAEGAAQAAGIFCMDFEKPGIPHLEKRQEAARNYYEIFKSGKIENGQYSGPSLASIGATNSSVVKGAVEWAAKMANTPVSQGGAKYVWGGTGANNGYDCAKFVDAAWINGGGLAGLGYPGTSGMESVYKQHGFIKLTPADGINFTTGTGLQTGDVLVNPTHHAEIMISSTQKAGAHTAQAALDKQVTVGPYKNYGSGGGYKFILRYSGS